MEQKAVIIFHTMRSATMNKDIQRTSIIDEMIGL
jgi:hypothetical protein